MGQYDDKLLTISFVIAYLAIFLLPIVLILAVDSWFRRRRERRYWLIRGPLACPYCNLKYEPNSDKGWKEIEWPIGFDGRVFECQKCKKLAVYEPAAQDAKHVGSLIECGYHNELDQDSECPKLNSSAPATHPPKESSDSAGCTSSPDCSQLSAKSQNRLHQIASTASAVGASTDYPRSVRCVSGAVMLALLAWLAVRPFCVPRVYPSRQSSLHSPRPPASPNVPRWITPETLATLPAKCEPSAG
jgi:hypothetical protein